MRRTVLISRSCLAPSLVSIINRVLIGGGIVGGGVVGVGTGFVAGALFFAADSFLTRAARVRRGFVRTDLTTTGFGVVVISAGGDGLASAAGAAGARAMTVDSSASFELFVSVPFLSVSFLAVCSASIRPPTDVTRRVLDCALLVTGAGKRLFSDRAIMSLLAGAKAPSRRIR